MPNNDQEYTVQRFRGGFALVWWEGEGEERKRRRHQLEATDRQSAEAEARRVWEDSDDSPWTVERIMTAYLASIVDKPSHSRREDAWKAMRPFWQNVDPVMIDEPMARAYRASRPIADATARYELMQLSTALGWAAGEGKIPYRMPVWLPPVPDRKTRHLTRREFDQFFVGVIAEHAKLYVQLALHTVARPGAVLDLTWDRVDFMRGLIDFEPRGRVRTAKRRPVVPIGETLLPWLQRGFEARTCDYVIERGGKRVANIKKAFQAASERSGVHATPYTLRHTGAVWAAEAGVPMAELAQFMGHDDDRTTQKHYARFSPNYLRNVANAIGKRA